MPSDGAPGDTFGTDHHCHDDGITARPWRRRGRQVVATRRWRWTNTLHARGDGGAAPEPVDRLARFAPSCRPADALANRHIGALHGDLQTCVDGRRSARPRYASYRDV